MDSNYEREYLIAEQTHPWFVYRRKLIWYLLKGIKKKAKILEIGCGSGINLKMLQRKGFYNLYGIEPSRGMGKPLSGIKMYYDFARINQKFDIILLLDVLEHIRDDVHMLKKLESLLSRGGELIITVPSFSFLWGAHDELNNHYRRYNSKQLKKIVKKTSLRMKRIFYWNFIFFFPIALLKIVKRTKIKRQSDISFMPPFLSRIYSIILNIEHKLIKIGINFPFGVSLVGILKNKSD